MRLGSSMKATRPHASPSEPTAATGWLLVSTRPSCSTLSTSYVRLGCRRAMCSTNELPRVCASTTSHPLSTSAGTRTARRKRPVPMHTASTVEISTSRPSGAKGGAALAAAGIARRAAGDAGDYHLNPSSEPDPVRRSSRRDGGCPRAVRAPTVGIKRARYATPSTVAPAWSAKRCEHARPQDSLTIAQRLRRATQSAQPVQHTALSGRDSGS